MLPQLGYPVGGKPAIGETTHSLGQPFTHAPHPLECAPMYNLPIDDVIEDIRARLRDGPSLVLEAPPGAGKTTVVPLALRDEPWAAGRKIVMLEPRRLAA